MAEMESINDPTTWGRRRQVQQALLERKAAAYDRIKAECANTKREFKIMAIERIIEETEEANG